MDAQETSIALLSVTQSIAVFTSLLPPVSDVRKAVGDASTANDVHMAELMAGGIAVGIGVTASMLINSPAPAAVAVVVAVGMALMYESVLQSTPKEVRA
jgi:hypothetical protein